LRSLVANISSAAQPLASPVKTQKHYFTSVLLKYANHQQLRSRGRFVK
jgi:hypothetical protein